MREIVYRCDRCHHLIKDAEKRLMIITTGLEGYDLCPDCANELRPILKNWLSDSRNTKQKILDMWKDDADAQTIAFGLGLDIDQVIKTIKQEGLWEA